MKPQPQPQNIETITILHNWKKVKIVIDRAAVIDFDNDYIHAPDTDLFNGIPFGRMRQGGPFEAAKNLGYQFYKIIEADPVLQLPVPSISNQ